MSSPPQLIPHMRARFGSTAVENVDYVALGQLAGEEGIARDTLTGWYAEWLDAHATWLQRTRLSYNFGIVVLLAGVAVTLVPHDGLAGSSPARLAAIVVAFGGAVGEAAWTLSPSVTDALAARRERRQPQPG